MDRRRRITCILAALALGAPSIAHAQVEPCEKNHYILDEPCALGWTAINNGLYDLDVRVVGVDPVTPATLYAGGANGLFKSVDGGASWIKSGPVMTVQTAADFPQFSGMPPWFHTASIVSRLAIDPRAPNTLYVGTIASSGCVWSQRRIFKSVDGGASWTDAVSPFINGCDAINSLVLAPSNPAALYIANFDGMGDSWSPVARTVDGAATWTYLGYPVMNVLAVDPIDSRVVYGGTFHWAPYNTTLPNGVLKSTDGGVTWAATGLVGAGITALAVDPSNRLVLYAARSVPPPRYSSRFRGDDFAGLFKSVDGGANWVALSAGLLDLVGLDSTASAVVIDPTNSNTVYMATGGSGVARSLDAGATWAPFNEGLPDRTVRSLALVPGNPATLYAGTPSGVFKITWRR